MRVRDVMSTEVVTVGPSTPFQEIVGLLLGHDISGAPVVDGGSAAGVAALLEGSHLAPAVRARVEHGVVILEGHARDDAQRRALPTMVEPMAGVVAVVNLVGVGPAQQGG